YQTTGAGKEKHRVEQIELGSSKSLSPAIVHVRLHNGRPFCTVPPGRNPAGRRMAQYQCSNECNNALANPPDRHRFSPPRSVDRTGNGRDAESGSAAEPCGSQPNGQSPPVWEPFHCIGNARNVNDSRTGSGNNAVI